MSNKLWKNDKIQFARLICEIDAEVSNLRIKKLCGNMDLSVREVNEIFDRAHRVWEDSKAKNSKR